MLAEPCSPGVFDDGIMIRHLRAFLLGLGPEVFLYLFIYLFALLRARPPSPPGRLVYLHVCRRRALINVEVPVPSLPYPGWRRVGLGGVGQESFLD